MQLLKRALVTPSLPSQKTPKFVDADHDSDWTGCPITRSTQMPLASSQGSTAHSTVLADLGVGNCLAVSFTCASGVLLHRICTRTNVAGALILSSVRRYSQFSMTLARVVSCHLVEVCSAHCHIRRACRSAVREDLCHLRLHCTLSRLQHRNQLTSQVLFTPQHPLRVQVKTGRIYLLAGYPQSPQRLAHGLLPGILPPFGSKPTHITSFFCLEWQLACCHHLLQVCTLCEAANTFTRFTRATCARCTRGVCLIRLTLLAVPSRELRCWRLSRSSSPSTFARLAHHILLSDELGSISSVTQLR